MIREPFFRLFAAVRGFTYAAGFVALWAWLAILVRRFDPRLPFSVGEWARPLGLSLGIVGAAVALACVTVFATRGNGTPAPFDAPRVFVASGPYRFVRNPMYLGAAAVIAGSGIAVASPAIVLLAVGFLVFFHLFVVLYEEPTLRASFGDSYVRYTRSIRRWLPTPHFPVAVFVLGAVGGFYLLFVLVFPRAVAMIVGAFELGSVSA